MIDEHIPVLIVGGGIVGLSASLFLSRQGVSSLLVERHRGTSIHPRARGVNARMQELYRELHLEEAIRVAGAELSPSFGLYTAATLYEVIEPLPRRTEPPVFPGAALFDELSPTSGNRITQDLLEPLLLAEARKRGGDLRFFTELSSFEQDEDGVTATIVDRANGTQRVIRADYMIAADGAGSFVRSTLGASVSGSGSQGFLLNILFHANLREFVRDREFSICLIDRPEVRGLFTSINNSDRWVFHLSYDPAKGEMPEDFPPERCTELLRLALGMPEIAIEIESILPWEAAVRVVDNLQHGRIFFAGDAAHQMPPWGGQGANTGVSDVHNLAWKLAAVLKGQAAPSLLATYDAERQPIDRLSAEESGRAADERGILSLTASAAGFQERRFRMLGYGYQYTSSAIIEEPESKLALDELGLDGRPGTRAPHAWVEYQGQRISTLDLFGTGFVLLAASDGTKWCSAARQAAQSQNIELATYRVGLEGDLLDPEKRWQEKASLSATGALLIRPDGFVAWRAKELVDNPQQAVEQVLRRLLK